MSLHLPVPDLLSIVRLPPMYGIGEDGCKGETSPMLTSHPRQRLSQRQWLLALFGQTRCHWLQQWLCVFCPPLLRPAQLKPAHILSDITHNL